MATSSAHGKNSRPALPLTWLLWRDELLSWGIPLLLIGAMGIIALLGGFGLVTHPKGVVTLGWLLLLLLLFFLLRSVLTGAVEPRLKVLTLGFALAWIGITWTQMYFAVFVGEEIAASTLTPEGAGVTCSLRELGTAYDLVVAGSFTATGGGTGRDAGYRISLEKDGQKVLGFPEANPLPRAVQRSKEEKPRHEGRRKKV
jgi:hypothetical protein